MLNTNDPDLEGLISVLLKNVEQLGCEKNMVVSKDTISFLCSRDLQGSGKG